MEEKIFKEDQRGYKNLFLQIFQLKNFLICVGGGVVFVPLYADSATWPRILPIFYLWGTPVVIWFVFVLLIYKGELENRLLSFLMSLLKKIIPIGFVIFALYLLLVPLEYKNIIGISILLILAVFMSRNNKKIDVAQKSEKSDLPSNFEGWTATETNNEQGTDFKEVNLKGKSIKTLEFRIKPSTLFWRAGFKLTDPNGSVLPLRTKNSLLFHVGSWETRDKFGATGYRDGEWDKNLNKTIDFGDSNYVTIKFQVNSKNFIECYINDKLEYKPKERIDPRILEKVFLVAWGDGNPYRVEIDKISYSFR